MEEKKKITKIKEKYNFIEKLPHYLLTLSQIHENDNYTVKMKYRISNRKSIISSDKKEQV